MINKEMYSLGSNRSAIRELFEYGKQRAKEFGEDSVFDFSLGNPSVPAPKIVNETVLQLVNTLDDVALHGYTSAQGDESVRFAIAQNLNERFGCNYTANNIYMTCGAAAGLAITLNALCEDDDEFIVLAPHFPEYKVFIKSAGGTPVVVPFGKDFQIDFDALEKSITKNTKAIIVNSPNNPSGVVYTKDTVEKLANMLNAFALKFNHPIFIIADEPYRELVYDDVEVPFIPAIYDNTILCYSFSKSLSLAGERIGYLAVSPKCTEAQDIYFAILGAGRALGYVCAPSLFQRVVANCITAIPNLEEYKQNRDLLYNALTDIGFECARPNGAFYLFVKAIGGDANAVSQKAKQYGLLLVPGDGFAANGWLRIAYCVNKDMILRAIPHFKTLYDDLTK